LLFGLGGQLLLAHVLDAEGPGAHVVTQLDHHAVLPALMAWMPLNAVLPTLHRQAADAMDALLSQT